MRSMNLQSDHLSVSMTQVARRWWREDAGVCWGDWMIEMPTSKGNRDFLDYFGNPLSELPLIS
jgi:hypothetical protein